MSWSEIEQRVAAYRLDVVRSLVGQPEKPKQETRDRRQQEITETRAVLEKLQARDTLAAIKEEIWHEGEIKEEERIIRPLERDILDIDLILQSNPYPLILLGESGNGRKFSTRLIDGQAQLSISVTHKFGEEQTTVQVHAPQIYWLAKSSRDVQYEIKQLGLKRGLQQILRPRDFGNWPMLINSNDPKAVDHVLDMLVSYVDEATANESLPNQVRAWSESLLSQFPPDLKKNGVLSYRELRSWEDEIRNSPRMVRTLHQIFP